MSDNSDEELAVVKRNGRTCLFESDNEEEKGFEERDGEVETVLPKSSQNIVHFVDDSNKNTKRIDFDLYDCEDSDDNVEEEIKQISIPDIFAGEKSDSSDEIKESNSLKKVISDFNEELVDKNVDEIKKNKSKKTKKEQKHSKDALLEISSETHRMIREKRMRLPYHQPKQRTLTEFLARKKTILPISINATVHQLHEACKHLENLEKEVEIFYKHDKENSASIINEELQETNSTIKENPADITNEELQETNSTTLDVNNVKQCYSFEDNLDNNSCNVECSDTNNSQITSNTNNSVTEKFNSGNKNRNNNFTEVNKQDNSDGNFSEISVSSDNSSGPQGNKLIFLEESLVVEQEKTETIKSIEMYNENHSNKNEQTVKNSRSCDIIDDISILELQERYQKLIGLNDSLSEEISAVNQPIEDILEEFKVNENDDDTLYNDNDATKDNIRIMNTIMKDLEKAENKINNTSEANKIIKKKYNMELPEIRLYQNDSVIELDYDVSVKKPVGFVSLMEKFFKHTNVKSVSNKKTRQINVLSAEKNTNNEIFTINKETLILQGESDFIISDPKFAIPGAKHSMLKKELRKQMVGQKEVTWYEYQKKKQSFYEVSSDDNEEEKDDKCAENFDENDKLNYKPAYLLNDIRDEDLEEDDVSLIDYEKSKNKFVDDEAEESDGDCNEADAIEDLGAEDAEYDADDDIEAESDSVHNSDEEDNNDDYIADVVDSEEDDVQNKTVENYCKQPLIPNTTLLQDEKLQNTEDATRSIKSVFSIFQMKNSKNKSKETDSNQVCEKLLERHTTGLELEYKVTGLEDIYTQSQSEFTESQLMGICSDSFPISNARNDSDSMILQNSDSQIPISYNTSSHLTSIEEKTGNAETNRNSSFRSNSHFSSDESDTEELFRKNSCRKIMLSSDDENEDNTDRLKVVHADNVYTDDDKEKESELNEIEDDLNSTEHEEVFYDSEEEVVTNKAEQFFENEAELSESEWESEDENEKDLDEFEEEVGDKDEIDNDKLKEELGKIHMRQILDDDRQDIRLLQEMLLEDGELHSETKRHRKFQWKNILNGEDFVSGTFYDSDDDNHPDDDDDEESELQWRRSRHERDMFFLQNDMKNVPIDHLEDESNSQLLQIGRSVFSSVNSEVASDKSSNNASAQISVALSPNIKQSLKPKCGSFLSRGEMILSRLALTLGETKEHSTNGPKNSRNFVFASKSPTKNNSEDDCTESSRKISKRKVTTECTASVKKVKLFSDRTNPGVNTSNVFNETFKSRSLLALLNDG